MEGILTTQQIIDGIDGELQSLYLAEQKLKVDLDSIQDNIKKLLKARAILADEPTKKKNTVTRMKASDNARSKVLTFVDGLDPDGEFTVESVRLGTGMGESSVSVVIRELREEGAIDLVRMGGKTGTRKVYKRALSHAVT